MFAKSQLKGKNNPKKEMPFNFEKKLVTLLKKPSLKR
jgi:hypothetical protein